MAVQEVVENVLERILGVPTTLYFVARTDAGVHAWAQECTFFTKGKIPGTHFKRAMNALLPLAIRVRSSEECPHEYSVRRANKGKTYVYQLLRGYDDNPFLRRYVWRPGYPLDGDAMQEAAKILVGTHDFTSFRGSNTVPASPVRTIYDISFRQKDSTMRIYVTGDGFLYKMVRNIVGGLVDIGRGRLAPADFTRILAARDRRELGMTAPGAGLCLLHVYFEEPTAEKIAAVIDTPVPIWNN